MTIEEAHEIIRIWTKTTVSKWGKTKLLDNLKSDIDSPGFSVILESQPKQILGSDLNDDDDKKFYEALRIIAKEKEHAM